MRWNRSKRLITFNRARDPYRTWPQYPREEAGRGLGRRTFYRLAAALVILALLMAVRSFNIAGVDLRQGLSYVLTTDWGVQSHLEKAAQFCMQVIGQARPPAVEEVMGKDDQNAAMVVPVSGKVVRGFGWSVDSLDNLERFHPGIDIAAEPGAPVKAAWPGKVTRLDYDPTIGSYVVLSHGRGLYTLYACLSDPVPLAEGENVARGQVLGTVGTLGDVPGGGLHFELREKSKLVDPAQYLKAG
ncbi:MAG: M23 family metallopeptidase [Eubacteriales bacterium]|jgi:murein DD-endopeptidase MepM/ murein hydrolase activator NlpD